MTDTLNVKREVLERLVAWINREVPVPTRSASRWAMDITDLLAAAPKAEPVEADDFGDELLAFLFRRGLKVALDVSEIEALRQSAIRAHPVAQKGEPVGEIVLSNKFGSGVSWVDGKLPPTGTKLYTHPAPASDELLEDLGGGDVIALVDPERWDHPDAPQLAYANGWNNAIAKHKGPQS